MFAGVNVMNGTSMPKKYDCRSCGEEYPQGVKCDRCPPVEGVQEFYEKLYDRIRLDDFTRLTKITALEFALSLAEAYADFRATQERERADAAERERDEFGTTIVRLDRALEFRQKECESLRTELRDMREALNDGTAVALLLRSFADLKEAVDKPTAKKMGEFLRKAEALLSRKGEGS